MQLPHPRAVLWDMDGTMINSAEYHWLAWRDVMTQAGQPITYEQFAQTFGQRNDTILRLYFGDTIAQSDKQDIADRKEARYRHLVRTRGIHLLPGVHHWLDTLGNTGWLQAIASAAPRENIATILEVLEIGAYFGAIVASEDVQQGKPDPQVFLTAAERLGVVPAHCIVVEDAPAGIEGAHRAAMAVIGVQTTHPALDADVVVASLDELADTTFPYLLSRANRSVETI